MKQETRITKEELLHLSLSARLEIGEAEGERLAAELDAVLAMLEDLDAICGEEGEPPAHPLSALRADAVGASLSREELLTSAPDRTEEYVAVPRVVE